MGTFVSQWHLSPLDLVSEKKVGDQSKSCESVEGITATNRPLVGDRTLSRLLDHPTTTHTALVYSAYIDLGC